MQQRGWRLFVKKAFDKTAAATILGVTLPISLPVAAAIRITMGSPVLFSQERPGLKTKRFRIVKFRTMRHPTEQEKQAIFKSDGDRLTRLGKFLRATSLDELPQLLNVLRGDMSLVGPRPLLVQYLARYSPRQARRHEVLPGITGWAQVNGRNTLDWEERFEHDIWYIENWSLTLDVKILFLTLRQVIRREGISHEGVATMVEFMGDPANVS